MTINDNPSSYRNIIIAVLLLIVGGMAGYQVGIGNVQLGWLQLPGMSDRQPGVSALGRLVKTDQPATNKVDFSPFWEVWQLLDRDYLDHDKLKAEAMVDGAISGMTASLGDPYTMYLPPVDNQRSGEDLAGAFYGIGIELGYVDSTLAVISPLAGTPAQTAGIQAGDLILKIKDPAKQLDKDTTGMSLADAVNYIRGSKGTVVQLTLLRRPADETGPTTDAQPFEVEVKRGEIIVPSVEVSFVEHSGKKAAHIKLSRFGERTEKEWDDIVAKIKAETALTGIILDMRNNPGGFFDGAINVASEFIDSGVVVTQQGKYSKQDYTTSHKARLSDLPLDVLVNRGSASASEIVAGALRDRKDSKLIGEKTFGKGTVQDRRELENGGGIHITVGKWLLPKGSWIHEAGIPVDVEVKDDPATEPDEALLKAIETL